MEVVYSAHLTRRLKERKIPENYPKVIFKKARLHYFDTKTRHSIAVSKVRYADKMRQLAVAYDVISSKIEIVTIYPLAQKEIKNKLISGRWIKRESKNEKKKN